MTELEYVEMEIKKVQKRIEAHKDTIIWLRDITLKKRFEQFLKENENELATLNSIKQKLEAFEIIKKKNVNVGLISVLSDVEQYNQTYVYDNMLNVKWCLTQQEFDTLKEVLK